VNGPIVTAPLNSSDIVPPPIDTMCPGGAAVDCGPVDDTPTTVTLTGATPSLEQEWATDGTVWLLPGYSFTSSDQGIYSVVAIPPQFRQIDQPTPDPVVAGTDVPDTVVPDTAVPPVSTTPATDASTVATTADTTCTDVVITGPTVITAPTAITTC